jgi:probable HAF family extracellular repeat protein
MNKQSLSRCSSCTWRCVSAALFTAMFAVAVQAQSSPPPYQFSILNSSNGLGGSALDINDVGQVVGSSAFALSPSQVGSRATLWANGSLTDLGTLAGFTESYASAINNLVQVAVNNSGTIGGAQVNRGALWAGSSLTALSVPPTPYANRQSLSWVYDIDNSGTVAGLSQEWNEPGPRLNTVYDPQVTV